MHGRHVHETPLYIPAGHAARITGLPEGMIIEAASWLPGIDDEPDVRSKVVDGRVYVNLADCLGIIHDPGSPGRDEWYLDD